MKQDVLTFDGFVSNVQYTACLAGKLPEYDFGDFDINKAKPCGKIIVPDGSVAYSKWVSPKRTRSYPFARLYDILNAPKRITVIPVLKDEGIDGDLDRIQFSTISWMNLFDIYIVLAYCESAVRNSRAGQSKRNKISKQSFSPDFVERQILDILKYKNSALHWNFNLLETSFVDIYRKALDSYQAISERTGVKMHDRKHKKSIWRKSEPILRISKISRFPVQKMLLREKLLLFIVMSIFQTVRKLGLMSEIILEEFTT